MCGLVLLGEGGQVDVTLALGALADEGVGLLVDVLKIFGLDTGLDVLGEELGVLGLHLLVFVVAEVGHVEHDVLAVDVLGEVAGVVLLGAAVVTDEALDGVGDVDTTVRSTLHGGEDAGTKAGRGDTNVEVAAERAALGLPIKIFDVQSAVSVLDGADLTVNLVTLVEVVHTVAGESTAGEQEAGGVGSREVLEAEVDTVVGELGRVGAAHDLVSGHLGVDDLGLDVLVGVTHDKTVAGGVVLVLGLSDKALAGAVVGLALATAAELGLETLEVGLVLEDLDESSDLLLAAMATGLSHVC